MKLFFILFITLTFLVQIGITFSQVSDSAETSQFTIISGKVTGEKNEVLSGANLVIEGTIDGATSDEKGLYEFETEKTGQANLIVTSLDYATKNILIDIHQNIDKQM